MNLRVANFLLPLLLLLKQSCRIFLIKLKQVFNPLGLTREGLRRNIRSTALSRAWWAFTRAGGMICSFPAVIPVGQ